MHVHLIALLGCAEPEKAEPLPPLVELGTGEVEFVPLAEGDELEVVHGPQGGYHFTVSMRVQGIDAGDPSDLDAPNNPITLFQAFLGGERIDLNAALYRQGIDPSAEPGVYEMLGRRLILDIQSDAELDGLECLVDVTVTDADGQELHDERTVVAVPSPFN